MRRLVSVFSAVFLAAGLAFSVVLVAGGKALSQETTTEVAVTQESTAESTSEGTTSETTTQETTGPEATAPEEPAPEATEPAQEPTPAPEPAQEPTAEPMPPQEPTKGATFTAASRMFVAPESRATMTLVSVADNSTKGRFSASKSWIKSSDSNQRYGRNYRALKRPSARAGNAKFSVKIPSTASYTIQARWPSNPGYSGRATFMVKTASGWKARPVSQRKNGGKWVTLGTYKMTAGTGWKVLLSGKSSSKGYIIADAVRVVKQTAPAPAPDTAGGVTGAGIVAEARRHLGKPYVYGADGPDSFDCSGFTQFVYKQATGGRIVLPRVSRDQFENGPGRKVSSPQPGDLIFGRADGYNVDHIGIYTGNGKMIHSGNPSTGVVEQAYGGWYNVIGYRRVLN